jgi:hypothetical protein
MTPGTIHGHLATAIEAGEQIPLRALLNEEDWECITAMFRERGFVALLQVHNALDGRYDYGVLRVVRAALQLGQKFG